jgi:hypothetical protein
VRSIIFNTDACSSEVRAALGDELRPHPHWISIENGKEIVHLYPGWGDFKCDYCNYAADMVNNGRHACFEHRTTLVKEMEKVMDTPKQTTKQNTT